MGAAFLMLGWRSLTLWPASIKQPFSGVSMRSMGFSNRLVSIAIFAAASWLSVAATAQGQVTWDSSFSTTGPQDGTGTWSTSASGTNWWNGTTNVAWPNTSSSIAVFGASGTAGTVTVSGSVTAGGITFAPIASWATTRYSITGGTIGLGASPTILINGSASLWNVGPAIASNLVASNLTITATGPYTPGGSYTGVTFALQGANSLTGTTTLGGAMYFQSGSSGLGSATLNISDGVTFQPDSNIPNDLIISGFGVSGVRGAIRIINASRVFSGTVTLSGSANIWGNSGLNATFQKGFGETSGGPKSLTFQNSGTTFLTGKSTYTGTTSVVLGTVVLDGGMNTLSTATVLSLTQPVRLVLGGTVNGAVNQTVSGLGGAHSSAAIGGGAASISTLAVSVAPGASFTYQGMMGGTAANDNNLAFAKAGAGSLTLSGTSYTYVGNTTISGGTLALGANATIVNSPVITVGDAGSSGAVLDLTSKTGTFTFGPSQTVQGVGTINFGVSKTVAAQGIWAPGNSIGSNAVTGNLSLSGTSQFELGTPGTSAASPGTADFTAVSGTLALGGNLALLDNSGSNSQGSYGAGSYRLFAAPALSGTFASVTAPVGAATTRVGMVYTAGTASGQGVFANVYNLASATSSQTVNVGAMYAGSTKTTGVSLANSAPASATFTETLSGSFSGAPANFSATGSVSGIAGQSSGSGTLLVGFGSGLEAGVQTGTATLSLFSNAVNSSGLAQQAIGSQAVTITGTVWNPAAVNTLASVSLGNVRVGGSFGTQALSIRNTAASSSFTEVLGATGTTSGLGSLTGTVSALVGGGTSTAISLGLGGSANTGSAGVKSGTATISFNSTGGPGTASIASQNVAVTGTVWNMAVGSIPSGTTVSLGLIHAGDSFNASTLMIANTAANNGFSEGLNASVSGSTGNATFGGTGITNLAAGDTTSTITVSLGDTSTGGVKNGSITIGFQSNGSTTSGLSTISAGSQVVNLTGSVFSGNGIWSANGGGAWGSGANPSWTSAESVSAAPGTFAGFISTDTATFNTNSSGSTAIVTLGSSNPSLAALTFNSGSGSYQLSGGTLALNGGTNTALVTVSAGSHEIGSAVSLATSSVFSIANGSMLSLSGIVSGSSAGLTKTGQGRLVLGGANTYTGLTQVSGSGSWLAINGSVAGNVQADANAVLGGSGLIAGNLSGSGLIGPGNSPGILTVQGQLDATSTTAFAFELSGVGAPIWGSDSASVNDVLRLTATSPFTSSLAATNVVNVYFDRASLANGDTFLGGFFVDNLNSTANLLTNGLGSADFQYFVRGDGNGGYTYNGTNYYSLSQYMSSNSGITGVTQSVVNVASASFTGGTVTTGQVTQFVIVPEPAGVAIALVGILGAAGGSLRRRRRRTETSS